ncbi:ethanolamine ammonia-lyase subunit EutC [Parendozoicomonas haliclonae]|uniref:Ethanolamine ammonia-lyase small subunit n=1 Tax=Parendozoicomonas haliclonae TaxID=1960125 RepID=A0A1X7ALE1_9GAMM|nr:ethanolamine ammonia-lyase subunit EutC [Parendozoicomonas haliclonae]SMA48775.1 Ethanolamine ammonia-lyase light chain [Parendozoicomonas haliclonae]
MISENELKDLIGKVLQEIGTNEGQQAEVVAKVASAMASQPVANSVVEDVADADLPDITAVDMSDYFAVKGAENEAEYRKLKKNTPARLGIGRAGPRYTTESMLRFRADHAVAIDAVFNEVPQEFVDEHGLVSVQTRVDDKDMYVTRPDLGRLLNDASVDVIKSSCKKNPDVQIVVADGLSSSAITANLRNILPALKQGLEGYGYSVGDTIFVKFGRVGSMDHITEITGAKATVMLVGERPGLATGESMGCYMTWEGRVAMPEAGRTVISNIHRRGTPAAEAGAHIANIVKKMFENKCSGVDLKL